MTPVVVGIGQVANKDPERLVHPVELLEDAARRALADAGADLRDRIGAVYSAPLSIYSTDDGGAMVAERLGLPPGARVQARYTGAGPQHHLAAACADIAAGRVDAALLVGGIADASVRNARRLGVEPPAPPTSIWSQGSDGLDEGERLLPPAHRFDFSAEIGAGVGMPVAYFSLVESALGAAAGEDLATHRRRLGELLAPFTHVAASRPDLAWFPQVRAPHEIAEPHDGNRVVAEPYTKLMCSFPTIDMAAAVLVTSVEVADRAGVPAGRRVYPWSAASAKEHGPPSVWPELHRPAAYELAARTASELAGITPAGIATFDLYSCFPAAVQLGMAAFGMAPDDARPCTVTGGLPYFGGPGASYALHAIACTVEACRTTGGTGAVGALGGFVNDFGVGIYGAEPPARPFRWEPELRPAYTPVPATRTADAEAEVVAGSVLHDRSGPVEAGVLVALPDGSRLGARAEDDDLVRDVSGTTLAGRTVRVFEKDGKAWWRPA